MTVPPEVLAAVRPMLDRHTHRGTRKTSRVLVVRRLDGGALPPNYELVGEDLAAGLVSRNRAIAYLGLIDGVAAGLAIKALLAISEERSPHHVPAVFVAVPARGNLTIKRIDTRS